MKKLIYLTAVAGSLLLTTSCVDLTQEPESFITEEEYWNTVDQASLEKASSISVRSRFLKSSKKTNRAKNRKLTMISLPCSTKIKLEL
jgi:hypothetical protein